MERNLEEWLPKVSVANAILSTKLRYEFAELYKNDTTFKSDEICF